MSPAPINIHTPEFEMLLEFILQTIDDTPIEFYLHAPDTIEVCPIIPGDLEFLQKVLPLRFYDWRITVRL